ncbi:hypothetical protein MHA_2048 [Mannheimia haemolytica PHL213]|nr:hypothetical protein MHA_2048 [Mannheimia haemolytica PHL213]
MKTAVVALYNRFFSDYIKASFSRGACLRAS